MLSFYNNFISKSIDVVLDKQTNTFYLLIHKCATQSMIDLTRQNPARFQRLSFSTEDHLPFDSICAFVRDPIERFNSGLDTQIRIWNLSLEMLEKTINQQHIISFLDQHTCPQFWFFLKFGIESKIKFHIRPLNDINLTWAEINKLNVRQANKEFRLSPTALDRLEHFLTEDRILVNNFLGKTVYINEIIDRIKLEHVFVNDINQYKKEINYLF